jgi:hypothetical protein
VNLRRGSARTPLVLTAVTLLVLLALILFVVRGDRAFLTDAEAVKRPCWSSRRRGTR